MSATAFETALTDRGAQLLRSDGSVAQLDVRRWRAAAAGEDTWLLGRCRGATIDLGCGPGRLVEALARRGVPALGVDAAAEAIEQCRRRGVAAVHCDVFAPLPGEGSWEHVLLADGNVGIGGDPAALLRRAALLLGPGGTVLVELDPGEPGLWRGNARVRSRRAVGQPFPWAAAGVAALPGLAAHAGLRTTVVYRGRRTFAELARGVGARGVGAQPARDGGPRPGAGGPAPPGPPTPPAHPTRPGTK
ncbi:MAG: class I SAM-dependent methyltransferase, partial [Pseudonocardia sp.]